MEVQDWRERLAVDIGALIRTHNAMLHFQKMVREWRTEFLRQHEQADDYARQRERLARRAYVRRSKGEHRPRKDWISEGVLLLIGKDGKALDGRKMSRGGRVIHGAPNQTKMTVVGCWLPPELSNGNRPDARLPLPLPEEELTLAEKYTVLAAFHDAHAKATEKVDPWPDVEATNAEQWLLSLPKKRLERLQPFKHGFVRGSYAELIKNAKKLPASDEVHLLAVLAEVADNLREGRGARLSQPGPSGSDSQRHPEHRAATRLSSIPDLDKASPNWVTNKRAAELESIETRTLARYRHRGNKTSDGMSGIDCDGRMWRRAGTCKSSPRYYKPSLKCAGQKA